MDAFKGCLGRVQARDMEECGAPWLGPDDVVRARVSCVALEASCTTACCLVVFHTSLFQKWLRRFRRHPEAAIAAQKDYQCLDGGFKAGGDSDDDSDDDADTAHIAAEEPEVSGSVAGSSGLQAAGAPSAAAGVAGRAIGAGAASGEVGVSLTAGAASTPSASALGTVGRGAGVVTAGGGTRGSRSDTVSGLSASAVASSQVPVVALGDSQTVGVVVGSPASTMPSPSGSEGTGAATASPASSTSWARSRRSGKS
jgi:hypothetical protein